VGRLAVIGPTGCRYLDNEEEQRKYVQNGWNITGDSYLMDQDGYFWYQARTDDMIICSGYNISGPEVENVLLEHSKVAECAVVGAPDEARGQTVKAFVVLKAGTSGNEELVHELQEHVKRELAPYKYPRVIEFVDTLPRTLTGKLQRFVLRARSQKAGREELALILPEGWPKPSGYSHGMIAEGRVLTIAGQIGWDPKTNRFRSDDLTAQTEQALRNIVDVLKVAGGKLEHIVRLTWFVTQKDEYLASRKEIGRIYREIMGAHYPPMSVIVVKELLEPRAKVEIEATAVLPTSR
jgi:enamine deaminase RidA (YjgF/YER057c/UK114 family)